MTDALVSERLITDDLDRELRDPDLVEEIVLLTRMMVAAAESPGPLDAEALDRLLLAD